MSLVFLQEKDRNKDFFNATKMLQPTWSCKHKKVTTSISDYIEFAIDIKNTVKNTFEILLQI